MTKMARMIALVAVGLLLPLSPLAAQEKKLEKIRVGGGSVGAPQMTMWFAKEAGLYERHGLAIEAISIPGSSLAIQAMLSGEVPIIQLGGTASIEPANKGRVARKTAAWPTPWVRTLSSASRASAVRNPSTPRSRAAASDLTAIPASPHGPQSTEDVGRPRALHQEAKLSRQRLAAA